MGAQTDAQHRQLHLNSPADELLFFSQPWVFDFIINTHGAAHDNQEINLIYIRQRLVLVKMGCGNPEALLIQPAPDTARTLECYMLQYMCCFHLLFAPTYNFARLKCISELMTGMLTIQSAAFKLNLLQKVQGGLIIIFFKQLPDIVDVAMDQEEFVQAAAIVLLLPADELQP